VYKHAKIWLFLLLCNWACVAYSQQLSPVVFGSDLSRFTWHVWAYVFGAGAIGVLARVLTDATSGSFTQGRAHTVLSVFRLVTLGIIVSVTVFAMGEYSADRLSLRIPDLLMLSLISTASYFQNDVMAWMRRKLEGFITSGSAQK